MFEFISQHCCKVLHFHLFLSNLLRAGAQRKYEVVSRIKTSELHPAVRLQVFLGIFILFHGFLYFVVSKKTPMLLSIQAKPKMLGSSKREKYLKFIHQSL